MLNEDKQISQTSPVASLNQESVGDKIESTGDGEEDGSKDDQNKPDSDRQEEGCGEFPYELKSVEILSE